MQKIFSLFVLLGLMLGTPAWADPMNPELGNRLTPLPERIPAPTFNLADMDDEKHALEDYRGQVVLINFWATWCPPCRRELPSMERVYNKLKDHGFTVLAINQWEDADHVFAYTGQLDVDPSFPILFDPDSSIAEAYHVKGLPSSYIIDKQGQVVYRAIGGREFDHPDLMAKLVELIEE